MHSKWVMYKYQEEPHLLTAREICKKLNVLVLLAVKIWVIMTFFLHISPLGHLNVSLPKWFKTTQKMVGKHEKQLKPLVITNVCRHVLTTSCTILVYTLPSPNICMKTGMLLLVKSITSCSHTLIPQKLSWQGERLGQQLDTLPMWKTKAQKNSSCASLKFASINISCFQGPTKILG